MTLLSHFWKKKISLRSSLTHTQNVSICVSQRVDLIYCASHFRMRKNWGKWWRRAKILMLLYFHLHHTSRARRPRLNVSPNARNCGLKFESFFMFSHKTFSILLEWFCLLEIEDKLVVYGISSVRKLNAKGYSSHRHQANEGTNVRWWTVWCASGAALAFRGKWK